MNLSTYDFDLERFNYNKNNLTNFLNNHKMDGIELLNPIDFKGKTISHELVKGIHLKYYPDWLHFWNNNTNVLLKQFKDWDTVEKYYGGKDRSIMIEHYRNEIKMANKLKVKYMVFHASHVDERHSFNYNFTYTDEEVIDAAADLLNEVFKGIHSNIPLLFENVWWPGFTMLSYDNALRLLNKVNYPNKGFMLDTGHLMNSNLNLRSESDGVNFIIDTVKNLRELKNLIKGIHLNCSLSGQYVLETINSTRGKEYTLPPLSEKMFMHVFNIDKHRPFTNSCVKKILDFVKPEYVIYELIASSLQELEEYIEIQDKACL